MSRSLSIDLYSDVICPWCYIGKQRFEVARRELEQPTDGSEPLRIDVRLRAFMLDPSWDPDVTMPVTEAYAKKFGGHQQATQILERVTAAAAEVGLEFHMERAQRANTLRAHRLIWWAQQPKPESTVTPFEINDALMRAYFTEGQNISDVATLTRVAASVGADESAVTELLAGDAGALEVAADLERAADLGVTGVPTVVVNEQWGVSGAQEPADLVRMFRKVAQRQP